MISTPRLLVFAAALVLLFGNAGVCFAARIYWTGNAKVWAADGTDFDIAPTLGAPIFEFPTPQSFSGTSAKLPGVKWKIKFQKGAKDQFINLHFEASPSVRAEALATLPAKTTEFHRRIVLEAQYVITGDPTGSSIAVSPKGLAAGTGSLIDNFLTPDHVQTFSRILISESSDSPTAYLYSDYLEHTFERSDNEAAVVDEKLLVPVELTLKEDGLYRVRVEIDLAALAQGNLGQEKAASIWSKPVSINYGFVSALGTVPEPSSIGLLIIGGAALFAGSKLVRRTQLAGKH